MKILRATKEAQDILFTPRINASVVSLRIRGDADASDIVLPNVLTSIREGYHVVCVIVDLQENNYYSLDITFEDELIYRDRIFVTNQDLNKFSQDVGNRDTYTYYTDNTPVQNNNNRLLTSLCSSIMADNGIYEPCENDINMSVDLNGLTLFFNPRGYKTGVLYNTLPYNNTGNFTYSRTGEATRINTNGDTEVLALNVPQLDNSSGCPSLLLEPDRDNLFLNSLVGVTQNITLISDTYSVSFIGTGSITITGGHVLNGTGVKNRVSLTFNASAGVSTFTIFGDVNEVNVELGDFSTSWIPTETSSENRGLPSVAGFINNSIFNSKEGVLTFKAKALFNGGDFRLITISDNTTSNRVSLGYTPSNNQLRFEYRTNNASNVMTVNIPDIVNMHQIAIRYSTTSFSAWIDGVMLNTTPITVTPLADGVLSVLNLNEGRTTSIAGFFQGMLELIAYYNVYKSDEEMANLIMR